MKSLLIKLRDCNATCDEDAVDIQLLFYCPGCKSNHSYRIKGIGNVPVWQWNGSMEKPTFSPSLLVWGSRPECRCHLFINDGIISFLSDCAHDLKNTKVTMQEVVW